MSELTTDPITEAVARGMYEACPLHKDGPAWDSPDLDKDHGYAMTKRQWYLHEAAAAITAHLEALKAKGCVVVPREPAAMKKIDLEFLELLLPKRKPVNALDVGFLFYLAEREGWGSVLRSLIPAALLAAAVLAVIIGIAIFR